ncbi:amidase/6-aminohexanoate-cyclic-dimer hydrolase [Sphingomonas laterariae]|uniref:Amidase/6-aminohexanoate-cyclic-dimer hydrolase n=1 Tax=Edaphosphingomonas laterariae TaxID=861865 RepID=A0A239GD87_9SPHN|nr:amidase family protein [Sphingomonas laterariae]SNS66014.1 amidase/6-aminohexanoate-cyclic-dimer hydrolase [Sphingomonas laterariae]
MKMSRRETMAGMAATAAIAAGGANAAAPKNVLQDHDALGLADLVRRKQVSASELLEAAIARTEATNPRYNYMASKLYERARATVAKGLPDGPFVGVPWLEKDLNTHIAGEITGQGSRYYKDFRPTVTSELVKRHERAGLVIFGKTTTPEFGLTGTTESKATGLTRNPWNGEHIAGGSSGGAAAAVAAGVLPAAHATDGGGSIRIPASCCGLFGLKPSRGRVPMGPPRTEGWGGMSAHHAVTISVRDSAALLDATHGLEPGSRYGAPTPERPYLEEVKRNPGRLRIALNVATMGGTPVDPEVIAATRAAAKLCESLGHHVEEATPKFDVAALGQASFAIITSSIVADLQAREKVTGIPIGPDVIEVATLAYYQMGLSMKGTDYAIANNTFQTAAITMAEFMADYDVLLTPTTAAPPPKLGVLGLSPTDVQAYFKAVTEFIPFTGIHNQTGQPSMSVPLAMSKAGLPIGVLFSARYGDEATLFRLAGQLEQAAPWAGRRAPVA